MSSFGLMLDFFGKVCYNLNMDLGEYIKRLVLLFQKTF